ncbi:hypothetical protein AMECASPLE_030301 [Ameca splendens]|uniref:Uncharacterized protein n=1 Tax=Ameca splendens TaxID=208324 RepID=A0ABV1AD69_9TELE
MPIHATRSSCGAAIKITGQHQISLSTELTGLRRMVAQCYPHANPAFHGLWCLCVERDFLALLNLQLVAFLDCFVATNTRLSQDEEQTGCPSFIQKILQVREGCYLFSTLHTLQYFNCDEIF